MKSPKELIEAKDALLKKYQTETKTFDEYMQKHAQSIYGTELESFNALVKAYEDSVMLSLKMFDAELEQMEASANLAIARLSLNLNKTLSSKREKLLEVLK